MVTPFPEPPLLKCQEVSLGLQFVNDEEIAELESTLAPQSQRHRCSLLRHRQLEMPLEADPSVELGDIIVSVPTAERQALEQNHSLESGVSPLAGQPWASASAGTGSSRRRPH